MDATGTWQLVSYGWTSDGMHLRLRRWDRERDAPEADAPDGARIDVCGQVRVRRTGVRRCTGWFDFDSSTRHICPDRASVDRKSQCEACVEREGFRTWMRGDGTNVAELKPGVRAYVERPHVLYLACFGDDTVKVGMASELRKFERLWDQGPVAAMHIAAGDGVSIRRLEVDVSRVGFTEFMRKSTKLRLLTSGMEEDEGVAALLRARERIRARLPPEDLRLLLDEPLIVPRPPLAVAARRFRDLEEIDRGTDAIIEGEVVGASGSILVLNDRGIRQAIDVAELQGDVLEFNPVGEVKKEARQIGLF